MRKGFIFITLVFLQIIVCSQTPDQKKAETSVQKYMSSKNKKYLSIDFGDCFSSEGFAEELQKKYKTKKRAVYTIEHSYSIDGEKIKGMYFHLDSYYNVIIKNTKEQTIMLIADDSGGDRQDRRENELSKETLAQKTEPFILIGSWKVLSYKTSDTSLIKTPSEQAIVMDFKKDLHLKSTFIMGQYQILSDNKLKIYSVAPVVTSQCCNRKADLDLVKLLPQLTSYRLSNDTLYLKGNGEVVFYKIINPQKLPNKTRVAQKDIMLLDSIKFEPTLKKDEYKTKHSSTKSNICPKCKSNKDVIEIVYDFPTPESIKRAEKGEIKLGDCDFSKNSPKYYCKKDNLDF